MNGEREMETAGTPRRSVIQIIKELASDMSALIHQEIALAKAEIRQTIQRLIKGVGEVAVGGGVMFVGLLVLIAFTIIGLGVLLGGAYWLSSLIVAVVLLGVGGLSVWAGIRGFGRTTVAPEATLDSLKTTGEWAQGEVRQLRAGLGGNGGAAGTLAPPPARTGQALAPRGAVALESRPGVDVDEETEGALAAVARPSAGKGPALSEPLHKRVVQEIGNDDLMGQGAKVAFYMFTSLPPALLVLFALGGLFGGERLGDFLTNRLQQALPGSASDPNSAAAFLSNFIDQVVQTNAPGPLSIGLIMGLWAASAVFVALTDALNRAYDVEEDRSFVRKRSLALGVMVGFLILFIGASLTLIVGPQIAGALQLGGVANLAWAILQWPLALFFVVLAFFLVYYVLPNRDQSSCKGTLFKASALAAVLWLIATAGFRFYIANFGSYGETYGFVGAILVLLLWMYLTSTVILIGGEVASEMEREVAA